MATLTELLSSRVPPHSLEAERAVLGALLLDRESLPRAIEVLFDKAKKAMSPEGLPLVGQVAAGQPVLAEENIEEYVAVPDVAGGDEGEYVLRVAGESMRDAGILAGDFVVVRRQETAEDGEIVVALVGEEATVKRFFKEHDHVRLQPENREMEPIRSPDVRVLGKVVGVFRRV